MRRQISASRPSAVMKKSGARSARSRRWKSIARAAASNAGPRLAEVAGNASRIERSEDIGREGILSGFVNRNRVLYTSWQRSSSESSKNRQFCPDARSSRLLERGYDPFSAAFRTEMTAPRSASTITGERCSAAAREASFSKGVPAKRSPR